MGKLYSQFNTKWFYVFCVAVFELGSAVCGAAPSMTALIIGRTLAGLGGACMYLGVIMLLSFFTSPVERPRYIGMVGAMFGLGTM
jgi:MFS family permease